MQKHIHQRSIALLKRSIFSLIVWTFALTGGAVMCRGQITVVQLSDTHIAEQHSPHAADNLRKAVSMINALHPDAVVVTGDIGENVAAWQVARSILKGLTVPLFYAPGNHDVHTHNVGTYRNVFGPDYYRFDVRGVIFLVVNSQLLGNYDNFNATSPPPLPADTAAESAKMLSWLSGQAASIPKGATVIGVQHIPLFRAGGFPDSKPYWVVNDPYRSRELALLQKMGVKHMLVGHWHIGKVFSAGGITFHDGPATSWLPLGGFLGFAVHTISSSGDVSTRFVALPGAKP
jgi:3',5'-cyclic-AMP phosphodiesterase